MRFADVVFVNEQEAMALAGASNRSDALGVLGERTACVVVKQGRNGATAVRGAERIHLRAFRVNAVDTTGAGDSFAAGFVHGLLTKRPLQECLLLANATGALSATSLGGTAAQPDQETLAAFLDSHEVPVGEHNA
jgi:sugar/nucleoside kinase (ribokinase family)